MLYIYICYIYIYVIYIYMLYIYMSYKYMLYIYICYIYIYVIYIYVIYIYIHKSLPVRDEYPRVLNESQIPPKPGNRLSVACGGRVSLLVPLENWCGHLILQGLDIGLVSQGLWTSFIKVDIKVIGSGIHQHSSLPISIGDW